MLKFNNSKNCCLAPHTTINFDTMGHMRVCCYNSSFILGTYPKDSVIESWNSIKRKEFIDEFKEKFPSGCELCYKQYQGNNFSNGLFASFDPYDEFLDDDFPISFNFEFGTVCNYECIMCGGKWSSSIRKNREKLPLIKSPYDENFVKEIEHFIPKLRFANFLGGEPFLNSLYYKIWNSFLIKNRKAIISITTNGSVYNSRIENLLKAFPTMCVNVSFDSLDEKTYNFIRRRGNFKKVMENISRLMEIKKLTGIAFCPMIQNVYELPDMMSFCIKHDLDIWINTVRGPLGGRLEGIHENANGNTDIWTGGINSEESLNLEDINNAELIPEVSLYTLPKEELEVIVKYLNRYNFEAGKFNYGNKYKDFVRSLESLCGNTESLT